MQKGEGPEHSPKVVGFGPEIFLLFLQEHESYLIKARKAYVQIKPPTIRVPRG